MRDNLICRILDQWPVGKLPELLLQLRWGTSHCWYWRGTDRTVLARFSCVTANGCGSKIHRQFWQPHVVNVPFNAELVQILGLQAFSKIAFKKLDTKSSGWKAECGGWDREIPCCFDPWQASFFSLVYGVVMEIFETTKLPNLSRGRDPF